ncbi:hypothetical protein AAHB34_16050 [Paenarthrobacter ureafaciens]
MNFNIYNAFPPGKKTQLLGDDFRHQSLLLWGEVEGGEDPPDGLSD